MKWQLTVKSANDDDQTFDGDEPVGVLKAFLCYCVQCDFHDADLFRDAFDLMDDILDNPQDEYRLAFGGMDERAVLVLKPLALEGN